MTGIKEAIYRRRKIALLDRDGTIIEKVHHLIDPTRVHIIAYDLLRYLQEHNYALVVITNQSVIGYGMIDLEQAQAINHVMVKKYWKQGIFIDAVFMCPHTPRDRCDCRKPDMGLLHAVERKMTLDLNRSILIGDSQTDIQAGEDYGVATNILIPTNCPWYATDAVREHENLIGWR